MDLIFIPSLGLVRGRPHFSAPPLQTPFFDLSQLNSSAKLRLGGWFSESSAHLASART